jgi:regulator of cell morphogenesis and NO signaling
MTTATQSIREIVAASPSAAAVLERFEINLCTQGHSELASACAELQLSIDQVLEKLADAESQAHGATAPDLEGASLTRLIQHIVRSHHQTVRRELPRFAELSQRIALKHSEKAPHFATVATLIEQLREELLAHLEKEEQILFPYIVGLEEATADGSEAPRACFWSVTAPVSAMMREHDAAAEIMEQLSQLTNGFEPPEWACARNTAFHQSLAEFAKDLRQHVHLENDLLFPRAIALEAELRK